MQKECSTVASEPRNTKKRIIKHVETRSNRQGGKKKVEGAPKFIMEQLI